MRLTVSRSPHVRKKTIGQTGFRPRCEALEDRLVPTILPAGFNEFNLATGLLQPTSATMAPDGRIFITEQGGAVRIWDPTTFQLLPNPFLTVNTTTWFERGLQSLTFDPNFATNGYVYIYYTEFAQPNTNSFNRVTRWTANPQNPNQALPGSETLIIRMDQLMAGNHNGGGLLFGYDGMMYISTGENARTQLAQSLTTNLGKVLRIDPYSDQFPGDPNRNYAIPQYNPFIGTPGANEAILARGFRNPFTMALHTTTGNIYVNDVGGSGTTRREEINDLYGPNFRHWGGNFGWPNVEGIAGNPLYVDPNFAYAPGFGGSNCSIVGGDFYTWSYPDYGFPADYQDDYFFPDLCGRWIYRYDSVTGTVTQFATQTAANPVDSLAYGPYFTYLTRGTGTNTGALTLVYYSPTGAPGVPGGEGPVGNGEVVDGLTAAPVRNAPTAAPVAPRQLAEQPPVRTIDLLFATPVNEATRPAATTPAEATALDLNLWTSIV